MTLDITGLRYPSHNNARTADWDGLGRTYDEEYETYTYVEAFEFEDTQEGGTGQTHTCVYVRGLGPVAIVIDGEAVTGEDIEDRRRDADPDHDGELLDQLGQWSRIIDLSQESTYSAEGPMMSSYWPVSEEDSLDENELARLAAKIADLPLCVVYVDGTVGLALTGGGMDLSWEIAEAFIRIGYYPPTGLGTLPQTAGMEYTNKRRAIVQALTDAQIAESRRLVFTAERNIELHLPDVQELMDALASSKRAAPTSEGA